MKPHEHKSTVNYRNPFQVCVDLGPIEGPQNAVKATVLNGEST